MDELIEALRKQTEALNRLAESNEMLTVALLGERGDDGDDDERPGETYLDSRPA